MRIHDSSGPKTDHLSSLVGGGAAQKAQKATSGKTGAASATGPASDTVKVSVSSRAQELAARAEVDTAKVDRLKSSIADGSFKIDASVIASKIVGEDE